MLSAIKSWIKHNPEVTGTKPSELLLSLDDRQKGVYEEWKTLWENGGNLAIMFELEKRMYNLEQEKNK